LEKDEPTRCGCQQNKKIRDHKEPKPLFSLWITIDLIHPQFPLLKAQSESHIPMLTYLAMNKLIFLQKIFIRKTSVLVLDKVI
jgi:hypothetical protein